MAQSICPKCGNHKFEIAENEPIGSRYKIQLLQCAACGAIISALDSWRFSDLFFAIAKKLGIDTHW